MEYVEGQSLYCFLRTTEYSVAQGLEWLRQCAKGVAYLHGMQPKPIIHANLKFSSLIFDLNKNRVKICGFGQAHEKGPVNIIFLIF